MAIIHPGREAYKQFESFVLRAEHDGHFTGIRAQKLVGLFDSYVLKQQDYSQFVREIQSLARNHEITYGNRDHILKKAAEINAGYMSRINPARSVDVHGIQKCARRHSFVWFYKAPENSLTACFGNFYEIPGGMQYKGYTFRNSEAAFQAQKFPGLSHEFVHLDGDQAWRKAADLAKQHQIHPSWHHGMKDRVMQEVLAVKFSGQVLREALLATEKSYLLEHNPVKGRDAYWSDDHDGTGQNMLGQILMEQRGRLGGTGVVAAPKIPYTSLR